MAFIDSNPETDNQSAVTIFSGKMNLRKTQAKITPISVPIYELPEYMCVETKCVSQQYALENNIQASLKMSSKDLNKLLEEKSENGSGKIIIHTTKPIVSKKPAVESTQIIEKYPRRERAVQTNFNTTTDFGVQCERDLDEEWTEWEQAFESEQKTTQESAEHEGKFLNYVSQNTSMFPNGMLECLLCGEIANCLQEHQSHMAVHFGPRALCSTCGKLVGHQRLLIKHSYSCFNRPHPKSRPIINVQCPHLHCSIMLNSTRDLAKHLKRHLGVKAYYCLQCRKSFSSSAQFLVHRTIQTDCLKAKHIYLAKHSAKSNPKRCTVCMKHFSSARCCMLHRRRCILAYHKRLKKLLNPATEKL